MISNDVIYFTASIIGISSFFLTDILFLRILYLVSSILFVISGIIFHIRIISIMNSMYVAVNFVQIIRLLLERTSVLIPEKFKSIYNEIFTNMSAREFLSFVNLATLKKSDAGDYLCHGGDEKEIIILILNGRISIEKGTRKIKEFNDHFFIGEMRFLTQQPMSATVQVIKPATYLEWNYKEIFQLQKKQPLLYMKFLAILGKDLTHKLQKI